MKNVMDRGFLKPGFLKNTMADVTCGWSCRKKNVAERYINDILAQFSEAEEQERAEKALQSCLKRNPKKYDPATQEAGPLLAGTCMRVALQVNIFKKALIIYMVL